MAVNFQQAFIENVNIRLLFNELFSASAIFESLYESTYVIKMTYYIVLCKQHAHVHVNMPDF